MELSDKLVLFEGIEKELVEKGFKYVGTVNQNVKYTESEILPPMGCQENRYKKGDITVSVQKADHVSENLCILLFQKKGESPRVSVGRVGEHDILYPLLEYLKQITS